MSQNPHHQHLDCASTLVSTMFHTLRSYLLISHLLHPHQSDLPKTSIRSHHPLPMASHLHHDSFSAFFSSLISYPEWTAASDPPAIVAFQFFKYALLIPNLGPFCSLFLLPGGFSQFQWLALMLQS